MPHANRIDPETEWAVVIDVLRATSVMTQAIASGARSVITCREIEQARRLAEQSSSPPLLCGERGCRPIAGFDLGNSPAEYTTAKVSGLDLVLTTTNGTAAVEAAAAAKRMVAASFLNLFAVCRLLRKAGEVHLICAGTEGEITCEDVLLAGCILHQLQRESGGEAASDEAVLARELWLSWFGDTQLPAPEELSRRLLETQGGRNLVDRGYQSDLAVCAAIGTLNSLPVRSASNPATFTQTKA